MRPINAAVAYFEAIDFVPHDPTQIPAPERLSRDHKTYPSGSAINPGYAYGTFIPLVDRNSGFARFMQPYTVPVGATKFNQVPIKFKAQDTSTQFINPLRSLRYKGLSTSAPGLSHAGDTEMQRYTGNAQG